MMAPYHTALKRGEVSQWPKLGRHEGKFGLAFVADIAAGIPEEMHDADFWYSDPPWRHGYEIFAERAGREQILSYSDFMRKIGQEIRKAGKPTVMLIGKQGADALMPDTIADARLNGDDVLACLWNMTKWSGRVDSEEILRFAAFCHSCVGDFFCGYGRAGMFFAKAGKRYVMSDFNPSCIGFIAANEGSWG